MNVIKAALMQKRQKLFHVQIFQTIGDNSLACRVHDQILLILQFPPPISSTDASLPIPDDGGGIPDS